jgi:hypothetical protein
MFYEVSLNFRIPFERNIQFFVYIPYVNQLQIIIK